MSTILEQMRAGEALATDVIDMHGHVGRASFTIPDISPQVLIDSMDRLGINAMVCSPLGSMTPDADRGNDEVLAAMQAHPGRILGYVGLFPFDAPTVQATVERRLAQGFTGLKMHDSNNIHYNDPAYAPAHAIANERRLPVLMHTWGGQEEFDAIREVAAMHPDVSYLTAHVGSENEAGYIQLAKDCPNVYLELAFSQAPRGLIDRLVEAVGPERIVWGSDSYFYSQAEQLGRVAGADIPEDAKKQIFYGNARKILDRIQRA